MAHILQPTPENLDTLSAGLAAGKIAAVPTETVYGLACNALDIAAIEKVYAAKARPHNNPLILHIAHIEQLDQLAQIPPQAHGLIEHFWPGPLTIILPKKSIVPDKVTAGLRSVAIRMPSHPVFRELASRCGFPIAAPSANPFGYVSPTKAEHVMNTMGDQIDWILDGGDCESGIESTILSLVDPRAPTILRLGTLSIEKLAETLGGHLKIRETVSENANKSLEAPGLLRRHYSPHTKLTLFEGDAPLLGENEAILYIREPSAAQPDTYSLSKEGNLKVVAHNLYSQLQALDTKGYQRIFLELPEPTGIGMAILDRMSLSAAQD